MNDSFSYDSRKIKLNQVENQIFCMYRISNFREREARKTISVYHLLGGVCYV